MPAIVNRLLMGLLTVATGLCLAYGIFGAGYVVCTTPQATSAIGNTFSGWESAVFPKEDMAAIAEAARSFFIEGTSSDSLYDTIYTSIAEAYPDLATVLEAGSEEAAGIDLTSIIGAQSLTDAMEEYTLPTDALSHLQDCTPIFQTGRISTGVVAGFGVVGLIALGLLAGRKRVGGALMLAGSVVILALVALGAWAVFDFNGLFTWMHSMLFANGNWTFDADSLLIQLFPEAFWAAMAGLWVITSLVLAAVFTFAGRLLAK